jgi:hypothetical protein
LLWSSNQKCKMVEQKNTSCRAIVKQKCKMVEQKKSSESSKKMQDAEQKLIFFKMVEKMQVSSKS